MEGQVYMNYVHSSTILKQLTALWKNDLLCDAVLTVDNCIMARAHKIVLLAISPKLQSDSSCLSQTSFLDVALPSNITAKSVEDFLRYIYEGFLHLTKDNIDDMLNIAVHLEIPTLYKFCKDFNSITNDSKLPYQNTDKWFNYISDFSLDDYSQVRVMQCTSKVRKKPDTKSIVKECDSSKGQNTQSDTLDVIDLREMSDKPQVEIDNGSSNQFSLRNTMNTASTFYKHSHTYAQVQRRRNAQLRSRYPTIHKKQFQTEVPKTGSTCNPTDVTHSQTQIQTNDRQHPRTRSSSHTSTRRENDETTSLGCSESQNTTIIDTQSGRTFTLSNPTYESDKNISPTSDFSNMPSSSLLRKVLTEVPNPKLKKNPVVTSNVLSEILQADSVIPPYKPGSQQHTNHQRPPHNSSAVTESRARNMAEPASTSRSFDDCSNETTRGIHRTEERLPTNTEKTACVSASSLLRAIVENQYYGHETSGRSKDNTQTYFPKVSSPGLVSILQQPAARQRREALPSDYSSHTITNDSNSPDHTALNVRIQKEPTEEPSSSDQLIPSVHIKTEPADTSYEHCNSSDGLRFEITENSVNTSEERANLMGFYMSQVKKEGRENEDVENDENSRSSSDHNMVEGEASDDPDWHPSKRKRKKVKPTKSSYQF